MQSGNMTNFFFTNDYALNKLMRILLRLGTIRIYY